MARPKWSSLTQEQREYFRNGIGPDWFPDWVREFTTKTMSFFFDSAAWEKHDFGYFIGRTVAEKFEYDWKFFQAMLVDAVNSNNVILAINISFIFYIAVTLFGWWSFNFADSYQQLSALTA